MAIEGKDPKVILERLDSRLTMWLIGKLIEHNCLWFACKILDKIVDAWMPFQFKKFQIFIEGSSIFYKS